jgi:hypothetical protein
MIEITSSGLIGNFLLLVVVWNDNLLLMVDAEPVDEVANVSFRKVVSPHVKHPRGEARIKVCRAGCAPKWVKSGRK